MRCIQPDGTGTDLGTIDLSQDMFDVLQDIYAAGSSPNVEMVRVLREHYHVRFDVHMHRARLEWYDDYDREYGHRPPSWPSVCLIGDIIATERASRERVRKRAGPTGRPDIGSKAARTAARIVKRAA